MTDAELTLTVVLTRRPGAGWVATLDNGNVGDPLFSYGPADSAADLLEEVTLELERAERVAGQGLAALAGGAGEGPAA